MKSLMMLWKEMAEESAIRCHTSATRDLKTVTFRCEHEGLSFLTITLPEFGKDFQKSLDRGQVDRDLFTSFKWRAGLPRFLGGFLDRVFDRSSGVLLDDPCIDAILAIRQLTLMFGKILLPCSDTRVRRAMREFAECEQDVRANDARLNTDDLGAFQRIGRLLFADAFTRVDRNIYNGELIPKHGPGATADKLRGNAKYRQSEWPARLESLMPAGEFLLPNWRYLERFENVDILEPGRERPVRVVPVPKTLKTPRIIAIEPTAMQYAQQAIQASIRASLSKDKVLSKMIGFTDQTPNQRLAREGSLHGDLATLDLSEASDRVSNQLVRALTINHPYLHGAVEGSRSRKADVPGQGVLRLAKFASMGSALCFDVEAMVFCTLVFLGIEKELSTPLCRKDIQRLSDEVRIFGDDIIVPRRYVDSVVQVLTTFGSKVNLGKSFWTGRFRESCGKEYYEGYDISIVRVRRVFPTHRRCAPEVISLVSLRNQLYFAGYWRTCKWLDEKIRGLIRHFPVVLPSSPVLGRHSFLGYDSDMYDETLHRPVVRGYVVSARVPSDPLDGPDALLKCLLMLNRRTLDWDPLDELGLTPELGGQPSVDSKHLERAGRPQRVDIKLRTATPF